MMQLNSTNSATLKNQINLQSDFVACISVILIIVNIIPICIIMFTRKIRRIMSNKFLLNLLLSHLSVGVVYLVPIIIPLLQTERHILVCLDTASEIIAMLAMIVFTIDRFLCIIYPFQYDNLPKRLSYFMMYLCWLLGAIYVTIGVISSVYNRRNIWIIVSVVGSIAVILLLVSNILIFRETRRHIKVISASAVLGTELTNTVASAINNGQVEVTNTQQNEFNKTSSKELKKRFTQKKEIRAAYICILMVISYILFWLPLLVTGLVGNLYRIKAMERIIHLTIMNSIADPVIYISFNREVKSIITKRIKIIFQKSKTILSCT